MISPNVQCTLNMVKCCAVHFAGVQCAICVWYELYFLYSVVSPLTRLVIPDQSENQHTGFLTQELTKDIL